MSSKCPLEASHQVPRAKESPRLPALSKRPNSATASGRAFTEVGLNATIYHDTLDTIEETDLDLTDIPKEDKPVDLNATLPYLDATTGDDVQNRQADRLTSIPQKPQLSRHEDGLGHRREEPKVEPPFKSRRVQVPSADITKGISQIEPSPKKPPKRKLPNPTPQKIGVLVGVPCRRRSSIKPNEDLQKEKLKHLAVVFLLSRLKSPPSSGTATFEIRSLAVIGNDQVETSCALRQDATPLTAPHVGTESTQKDAPPPIFRTRPARYAFPLQQAGRQWESRVRAPPGESSGNTLRTVLNVYSQLTVSSTGLQNDGQVHRG
ncbi:hypothetical protein quinque_004867 [Culex quinquefasciatus]